MYRAYRTHRYFIILVCVLLLVCVPPLAAHHFKGLPHFNYFENYPQIPQDEFLGQSGDYECSIVIYDFQGIDKTEAQMPDKVCFYMVIFNLRQNNVYKGALKMEIMNGDRVIYTEDKKSAVEENIYTIQRNLSDNGNYTMRVSLQDGEHTQAGQNTQITVPFVLSSQKIPWGPWVAAIMLLCVVTAIVGSRRARVRMDRKQDVQSRTGPQLTKEEQ